MTNNHTTPPASYPCPNPNRNGCGCPHASTRCYGQIRWVREEFNSLLNQPGPTQGDREVNARRLLDSLPRYQGWTKDEVLRRF